MFLLIWLSVHRRDYLIYWALGFLFGAIGWAINLVPIQVFGLEPFFWLIDIILTLVAVSFVTYGFVLRSGRPWKIIWFVFATFIAVIWVVYFSSFQNDFGLKMAVSPWFVAICMLLNAYIVWRKSGSLTVLEKLVAIVCFICAMIHGIRGMLLMTQTLDQIQNFASAYDIVSYLILPANYTAVGVALLLLVIADLNQRANLASIVDQQSQLLNRRGIAELSEKVMANCQRASQPISLILIDIDYFDSIRQQYGAKTKQQALSAFTKTITDILHKGDFIGQLREDRFVVVLPNMDEVKALNLAEQMRLAVGQISIQHKTESIRFTASLGVLSTRNNDSYQSVISRAEQALSEAERVQRNRVVQLL